MKLITKIYLAFGSILLIFTFVTISYVVQSDTVERNTNLALQSSEILRLGEGLEKAIVDAETGVRGFLITENEAFLAPYFEGISTYNAKKAEVQHLLSARNSDSDKEQLQTLQAIDSLFTHWQTIFAERSIALKRQAIATPDDHKAADAVISFQVNVIKKGVGKKIIDKIRSRFNDIQLKEIQTRDLKLQELQISNHYTDMLSIGLTILSIIIGVVVVYLLAKAIKGRLEEMSKMANEVALGHFNVQLTDNRHDEISQVSDSLNIMARRLDDSFTTLQKKNQELDQFAYVVSHDLKAPLRAINSLAEWIEEDLPNLEPDVKRNLDLMRGRVYRMENLINGILEYSRIGRKTLPVSSFSTAQLISEITDSLAPDGNVTVQVDTDMPDIITERILLQQVFTNLISNAIKYNDKPTPLVRIGCKPANGGYDFWVADNGPGIPEEYHQKVFGIFQTMEARDTRESTGIGLAIVKKIIDEKGGHISINSPDGHGTTFNFFWPEALEQ